MLELKNNKHNTTYYRCTYLYIVNAVIFKLLLTYYLKRDLATKKQQEHYHFNMSCNIRACKGSARSSCSIFSRSELIWQYWWTCCSLKGRGTCSNETPSKLFANHNTETANQSQHISFFRKAGLHQTRN